MSPSARTQDAAGFAADMAGLAKEAKRDAHQAIEDLATLVSDDNPGACKAVLSITKALTVLGCIEKDAAGVIAQDEAVETSEALS